MSRDSEDKGTPPQVMTPPVMSPVFKNVLKEIAGVVKNPLKEMSPPAGKQGPIKQMSPPVKQSSPPLKQMTPPKKETMPPNPVLQFKKMASPPKDVSTPIKATSPPKIGSPKKLPKEVISPPVSAVKLTRTESKLEEKIRKLVKEAPIKPERKIVANDIEKNSNENDSNGVNAELVGDNKAKDDDALAGVGDKIKKFEKAAEDASSTAGRLSRPGSVRGRSRTERLGSDGKDDFPPPATPFRDNIHFDLAPEKTPSVLERQQSITKNSVKWQRSESNSESEKTVIKPEPQKIIKPEFKPIASPAEVTIRSPSLGGKIPEQFPSQGTAFRNVASPDTNRNRDLNKPNEDFNTQNNVKTCKLKNKEKYSVSKGSSYFMRGSEEIWLVKKKDIEEIEERVLDSFRRAGGNVCMRSESMRPSSDSGHVSFSHATMGRTKRQMYARSESLDPQVAGARAQTLKRQTSVACTCGHDKKSQRAKSAGAEITRPRSRSHGDENNQTHVLDKYETLV